MIRILSGQLRFLLNSQIKQNQWGNEPKFPMFPQIFFRVRRMQALETPNSKIFSKLQKYFWRDLGLEVGME